jgi:SMC interacting uncharacterized protein involved in chromosome segregation
MVMATPELQDAINKIKTVYDGVQTAMEQAQSQLAKTREEIRAADAELAAKKSEHGKLMGELEAKRVEAERAAEENAKRIALNNDQVAELTRIKGELDKREKDLARREQAADLIMKRYSSSGVELDNRLAEVARKEAEIARRMAKMKEALS